MNHICYCLQSTLLMWKLKDTSQIRKAAHMSNQLCMNTLSLLPRYLVPQIRDINAFQPSPNQARFYVHFAFLLA